MSKFKKLSGFQILTTIGSANNNPLIRLQFHQNILGFRQRLQHIKIAPCPGVIIVSEFDTNRFCRADVILLICADFRTRRK